MKSLHDPHEGALRLPGIAGPLLNEQQRAQPRTWNNSTVTFIVNDHESGSNATNIALTSACTQHTACKQTAKRYYAGKAGKKPMGASGSPVLYLDGKHKLTMKHTAQQA